MKYYLAYGSNLNIQQMANRCPRSVPVGATKIEGYGLVFRRGYLTIEPRENSSVQVGIYRISDADEKALDRYEGFPRFYRKETFMVPFEGAAYHGDVPCMAYVMNDGFSIQRATKEYLRIVALGFIDFGFDLQPLMDADLEAARNG